MAHFLLLFVPLLGTYLSLSHPKLLLELSVSLHIRISFVVGVERGHLAAAHQAAAFLSSSA